MATATSIFNRPPSISEDTLVYSLYPSPSQSSKSAASSLATLVKSYVDTLLPSYFLWHRDPFELKVVLDPEEDGAWMLEGRMRVGDAVDDEWAVLWLLREISKKWDVVIGVFDSDGEFLLIEAAEHLPSWVTPTNAENRVWIYSSNLHLIPLLHASPPSSKRVRRDYPTIRGDQDQDAFEMNEDDAGGNFINPGDATNLVRDPSIQTQAPEAVERVIWNRISGYPPALRQHVHTTKAYLPSDIALALRANPSLVQKAAEAFYTRDQIQLRAAQRMTRFPPSTITSKPVSITMTRTAYAQLVSQKFHPPKIFGRWAEREGTKEWRWRDVGMKVACGFEMLYQENKSRHATMQSHGQREASTQAFKETLRRTPDYSQYIANLVQAGYFKGELEGSEIWNSLEDKAAQAYVEAKKEDDTSRPSFTSQFSIALSEAQTRAERNQSMLDEDVEEDLDDWLNVNEKDLEAILQNTLTKAKKSSATEAAAAAADAMDVDQPKEKLGSDQAGRLRDLAKKVEEFVEGQGDVEGARFSDEASSGEELSDFSDEESEADSDESDKDMTMDDAAKKAAMDNLVAPIDPSEYGRMPASFHRNSQRVARTTVETDAVEEIISPQVSSGQSQAHDQVKSKPIRPPILPRDKYEGVDSDDETDEENENGDGDEEEEEELPQVVGEVEVDMEEEQEEFIEFARQALGLTDEQWGDIIQERRSRGAFVPEGTRAEHKAKSTGDPTRPSESARARPSAAASDESRQPRRPEPGPRPNVNPELDSFEAVMQAMDAELSRLKSGAAPPSTNVGSSSKGKGKAKADEPVDDAMDIEAAMDAELKAALERGDLDEDGDEGTGDEATDYNMIKNFLESFNAQAGLAGPVGNLAGRLQPGWNLPQDG